MKIRKLKKYPGYAVSIDGHVFSCKRRGPQTEASNDWVELTQFISVWGYPIVGVSLDGKPYSVRVHCLVAAAWIGQRPKGYVVNHKDGDKQHNHANNLEYTTHSKNLAHARRLGLAIVCRGEKQHCAKLTEADVILIRRLYTKGSKPTQSDLAKRFGVGSVAICDIVNRRNWKHI